MQLPDLRYLFYMLRYTFVLALLPASPTVAQQQEDACTGGQVDLDVTDLQGDVQHVTGMPAGFGKRLPHGKGTALLQLDVASDVGDACQPLEQTFTQRTAILVPRGGCEFLAKARNVLAANASMLLLHDTQPDSCVVMGHNSTREALQQVQDLYAVSISQASGSLLVSACSGAAAKTSPCIVDATLRRSPVFDVASLLLWAMAVATVASGAALAGMDYQHMMRLPLSREDEHAPNSKKAFEEEHSIFLTAGAAVGFVFVASSLLLVMYFFLSDVFYWMLVVLYCLGAVQAMTYLFSAGVNHYTSHSRFAHVSVQLPWVGRVTAITILAFCASTALALLWCFNQQSPWAFVAQNTMGICLMLCIQRFVRLPDLRVGTLLLSLAFCYDVFWVFIQPRLFGGSSVMAAVAEGGKSSHFLPMLLVVPHKLGTLKMGLAMLGFGDVVLPGQLIVLTRVVDIEFGFSGSWGVSFQHGYFVPAMVAYGLGLFATYVALYFEIGGDEGQPALLYLVPFVLGTVAVLAKLRGQFALLWGEGGLEGSPRGSPRGPRKPVGAEDDVLRGLLTAVDTD